MQTILPSGSNNRTHACQCGGRMTHQHGTVVRVIRGKEIRIHQAPFYQCSKCGEIEFDLSSRISSIAVKAYRDGTTDIIYSKD